MYIRPYQWTLRGPRLTATGSIWGYAIIVEVSAKERLEAAKAAQAQAKYDYHSVPRFYEPPMHADPVGRLFGAVEVLYVF
jgi:hypothetical protein